MKLNFLKRMIRSAQERRASKYNPIPNNLEECFEILKEELSEKDLTILKISSDKELSRYHHTLGLSIRNRWGLWADSPLKKYFEEIGLWHADDMSSLILTCFQRYLCNCPLMIEEEVKSYQDYWNDMGAGKQEII